MHTQQGVPHCIATLMWGSPKEPTGLRTSFRSRWNTPCVTAMHSKLSLAVLHSVLQRYRCAKHDRYPALPSLCSTSKAQ